MPTAETELPNSPTAESEQVSSQSDSSSENSKEPELSKDEIFHILQNERRRRVLQYITINSGGEDSARFNMRDIAEQVAAWENDTTVEALTSTQRQRVYIALYQSHLPKLDNNGLIDYNQDRGIVERRPQADEVVSHLDAAPEEDESEQSASGETSSFPWQQSYLGASILSLVLVIGAWMQLYPVSVLSGLELATLLTAFYAIVGAVVTVFASPT